MLLYVSFWPESVETLHSQSEVTRFLLRFPLSLVLLVGALVGGPAALVALLEGFCLVMGVLLVTVIADIPPADAAGGYLKLPCLCTL